MTDPDGHLVQGLPREVFGLYEDGQLQTMTTFTNERVPISVGVLDDRKPMGQCGAGRWDPAPYHSLLVLTAGLHYCPHFL